MLDKLLFALSDFVWAYNHKAGTYTFIGPNVQQVLGLTADEFAAGPDALSSIVIPEDRELFLKAIQNIEPDKWT